MGIVPMFGGDAIGAQVRKFQKRLEEAALLVLKDLGEELTEYAKDKHNYTDRTGNLTNSIGYAIARGSDIVYFGGAIQPGEGADNALKVAKEMAKSLKSSLTLIIVAGMNYAAYVEARGYNVILPSELKARTDFPKVMRSLMDKAQRKADELFGSI
jgi:hypothetical protein